MTIDGDLMTLPDLLAIAEILGHEADCSSLLPEDDWRHDECSWTDRGCSIWYTSELILSSGNLNKLLARAWDRGFESCALRVGQQLLDLLPRRIDTSNPYTED